MQVFYLLHNQVERRYWFSRGEGIVQTKNECASSQKAHAKAFLL